jgi:P-type E1-E2 ATPase
VQGISVDVPGWQPLELRRLVLDVNGTLALDGNLVPGVQDRIGELRSRLGIALLSADTHGTLERIAAELDVRWTRLRAGEPDAPQKAAFVRELGAEHAAAVGNGANDVEMLRTARLGIAVLGHEGLASEALAAGDVVAASIEEALDLLLHPTRLIATLRR